MTIFFTSDNHFFHKRISEVFPTTRPQVPLEELHELMISKWNSQVTHHDTVYCLGDFSFGKVAEGLDVANRLKGHKHLIAGNHDSKQYLSAASGSFDSIKAYGELKIDGKTVVLFHYPIAEWNKQSYGSYHLYGHVHGKYQLEGRAMDVGIDTRTDLGLYTWEEVDNRLRNLPIISHHSSVKLT